MDHPHQQQHQEQQQRAAGDSNDAPSEPPQQHQQEQQQQQADPQPIQQLGNCHILHRNSSTCIWECADFCGRACLIKQSKQQQPGKHLLLSRKLPPNPKQPCQQDAAGMCRVRKLGVPTPTPFHVDTEHGLLYMSQEQGSSLQQRLNSSRTQGEADDAAADVEPLLSELGRLLAVMHDGGVVHGALSSGCVLVRDKDLALLLRDFECFTNSTTPKDKAVDLVVLEADLQQQHPALPGLFDKVLAAYNKHSKQWSAVFNRLPEARQLLQKHKQGPNKKKARTQ